MHPRKPQPKSYQEDAKFLSHPYVSKDEFAEDYRKIYQGKSRAKELYFVAVAELKKTVSDGNVANFQRLSKLIEYINDIESPTLLKTFTDVDSPIEAINFVILAGKHERTDILKYIFSNSRVFKNLSILTGKNAIMPDDRDETSHDVFYYAIRSGNLELLELLFTKWPGNYFVSRSLELDEVLSRAYEHLKLQNVSLSNEMEVFVENKLINLRFFSNPSGQFQSARDSLRCIIERINLVLRSISLLKSEYSNDEKVDAKFLFVSKFIAQNIQILKRRLKLTYDRLPWEEIEFCLVAFVSSYLKQQVINLFYRAILNKAKILLYLENFAKTLESVKPFVESLDVSKLAEFPKLNRDQVVERIIRNDPHFSELYTDYQQIRDIHSLERVRDYLNLALSTDPNQLEGQIIITRALQVIGEYFKNTLESPKLSSTTSELLLFSLPKNTRKVIIDLRNSLSHAYSLSKRTEIYENSDANFFIGVQNDTKRVDEVITDILYNKRIKMVELLLKKIIDSKSGVEIEAIFEVLNSVKLEKVISQEVKTMELDKMEKLIQLLSDAIADQTNYEKELFDKINGIISSTKMKSTSIRSDYSVTLELVRSSTVIFAYKNLDGNIIREVISYAKKILERCFPQSESYSFKEIVELATKISNSAETRIQGDDLDKIGVLIYEISYIAEYDINDIKWVEKLRRKLQEKGSSILASKQSSSRSSSKNQYDKQLTDKLSDLKTILMKDLSSGKLVDYKKNKKLLVVIEMLVLDIMSILGESGKYLDNNLYFLDDNLPLLLGKSLRNHLAHGNTLLDVLLSDPSLAVILNAEKIVSENIVQSKGKIGKLVKDDPSKLSDKFDQDLITITDQEKMFASLVAGNLKEFKSCLEKGADINAKSIDSSTTLHFAAQGPNLELVKFIVDQRVSINVKDGNGQTPLHVAAAHGRKKNMEFFLTKATITVDDCDENGRTPLHLAAENGQLDIVELLLKNNANTHIKDRSHHSALHYAVRCNHVEIVEVLLKKEKNIDFNQALGGITSLHIAAEFGSLDVVNYLLKHGAEVNAKNDEKETPLHSAARYGHVEVVNTLIGKGARVNAKAVTGCIPLHYASETGQEKVARILLEHKSEVDAVSTMFNNTPLYYAAKYGHEQIVEDLLEHRANPNIITKARYSPLIHASHNGYLKIVTCLLKHGADIHARESILNFTALHFAVKDGHKEVVQLLIQNGADVNSKDVEDSTPLHLAASGGHAEIASLLIQNGAKICDQDNAGHTPLIEAAKNGNKGVLEILLENGAQVDSRSTDGLTALHVTTFHGHYDATVLLIKYKADVNAKTKIGVTPLHHAALNGHKEVVALLLENGALVDATSISDGTALTIAVDSNYKELVEILIASGADVNLKSNNALPLLSAIRNNNKELAEILISKGANVDIEQGQPLSTAVLSGQQDMVELLLKNHARVDFKGSEGGTVLHYAAARGHIEILSALISRGADINAAAPNNMTSLMVAVEEGHSEVVEILLTNGASLDINTPLHSAAIRGYVNVVNVLLSHGAKIDTKDSDGTTVLQLAVVNGHLPVVEILVQHQQVNLQAKGDNGVTLLHLAAQENNLELMKYLVNNGSDMHAKHDTGWKCIHLAAGGGCQAAVEFLLSRGMDVNELGTENQTPLHYATTSNRVEVVKYLISKGANVNARDNHGSTPMHMAAIMGFKGIIEVLLRNGAVPSAVDNLYRTPLQVASLKPVICNGSALSVPANSSGKKEVINLLSSTENLLDAVKCNSFSDVQKFIKAGAFIDARTPDTGATPLHFAAWKGFEDILNILLENRANPNSMCNKKFTALHYAAKFAHLECVKILMSHGATYNAVSKSGKTPVSLTNNKDITNLFKMIDDSFKKIKNDNSRVIEDLNKTNGSILKAIMNARNRENQCLIAFASQNNSPLTEGLKHVLQGSDSISQLNKALAFVNQGDYQRALNILQRKFEQRKQLLGPNNPATLDMQTYVAKALNRRGDYQKSLDMLEDIFVKQKEILGLDNQLTLDTRSTMALVLHCKGRDSEALDIYQEVYQKQKDILGANSEATLSTQFHMALVLQRLGKYDEALKINQALFEMGKKTQGPRHMSTISAQNNIALILTSQGKYDEALKIYKEVLELKKEIIGNNHADTLRTMQSIAGVLAEQKKFQEGLKAYEEVLKIQKKILQQNHPETLNTQYNIANVLYSQGKYFGAFKAYKECYDQRKAIYGPNHISVLDAYKKMEFVKTYRFKLEGFNPEEVLHNLQKDINSAAGKGDTRTIEHHLQNGADVNAADSDGRTPLHFAVSNGHLALVNILLKNEADVTLVTNKGNTPLHTAASKNYGEIVGVLLQNVDRDKLHDFVNAKTTCGGTTSLHVAAKGGYFEVVKLLLKNGATFDIQNKEGKTPVDLAADQKIIELLKLIEELFKLVKKGSVEAIDKLKTVEPEEFAVVTNARCIQGHGLLQVAIVNKHKNVAGALLTMLKKPN